MLDALLLCLLCFPGIAVPQNRLPGEQSFLYPETAAAQASPPHVGRARQGQQARGKAITDTDCEELAVVAAAAGLPLQPWEEPVRKVGNACRLFSPGPAERTP
jgi:hypothetical protein